MPQQVVGLLLRSFSVITRDGYADIRRDGHTFHVFDLADDLLGHGYRVDASLLGDGYGHCGNFVRRER